MRKILLCGLMVVCIWQLNCVKRGLDIVARVGTETISLREFEQEFGEDKLLSQLKSSSLEERKSKLEKMIEKKLMLLAAYEEGIDKDENIKSMLQDEEKKQVYLAAIQVDIYDKLIPESEVREFYEHMNEEVRLRHLLLRSTRRGDPQDEKAVKAKAEYMVKRIHQGEDFSVLAKKHSQDQRSAPKGGDLGYIRWGKTNLGEALKRTAFSLKVGEVSDPIKTQIGYHILKVEDKRTYLKNDFDEVRYEIQRRLVDEKRRKKFEQLVDSYLDDLKQKYAVEFREENIRRFAEKMALPEEQRGSGSPPAGENQGRFHLITEDDKALPLVTYGDEAITMGEFITTVTKRYPPYNLPVEEYIDGTKDRLNQILNRKLITYHGYKMGLQSSARVQTRLEKLKEELLSKAVEKVEIFGKAGKADTYAKRIELLNQGREQWLQQLRGKYKIKIYPNILKKAYKRF